MIKFKDIYGRLPIDRDKEVPDYPNETWNAIETALFKGRRGLLGRSSLTKIKKEYFSYIPKSVNWYEETCKEIM